MRILATIVLYQCSKCQLHFCNMLFTLIHDFIYVCNTLVRQYVIMHPVNTIQHCVVIMYST